MWRLSIDQCEMKGISEAKQKKQRPKRNTVTCLIEIVERKKARRIQENQVGFKRLHKHQLSAKPVAFMLGFFKGLVKVSVYFGSVSHLQLELFVARHLMQF